MRKFHPAPGLPRPDVGTFLPSPPPDPLPSLFPRTALALCLALAACDGVSADEQRAFEAAAFGSPSDGVTPGDWQVAPAFGTRVQLTQPPSPNPARASEPVSLLLYADSAPGGFALYRRLSNGDIDLVDSVPGVGGPNIYTFTFFGGEAGTASGSQRLIVLDGLERVVSFGDLVLEF